MPQNIIDRLHLLLHLINIHDLITPFHESILPISTSSLCEYFPLSHLINIHDLITPLHWSILPIDTYFAVRYFRLFPYDLIP